MGTEIKPVMVQGRIVYTIGDLFQGDVAKIFGTQQPKLNKQGQTYREYGFGLAVPKSSFAKMGPGEPGEIWIRIHEAAYTVFPNRVIPTTFHMKWKDGDTGTNQDGSPLNTKAGYPGHLVFNCKTTFPIKFFKFDQASKTHFLINEGIKCGDYIEVQLGIEINDGQANPGLYLNPMAAQFLGHGEPISNMPSAAAIFGTQAPSMPPGASATPLVPTMPNIAPAAPIVPNYGILPPAHQPAAPSVPSMPPPGAVQQSPVGFPPLPFR